MLLVVSIALFVHLDSKIDAKMDRQDTRTDQLIITVGEMKGDIGELKGAIGELRGEIIVIKERLGLPASA